MERNAWKNRGKRFRSEGLAFAIPMVLAGYPLGGALVGWWLERTFGVPGLLLAGVALGLYGGVVECARLLRILNGSTGRKSPPK